MNSIQKLLTCLLFGLVFLTYSCNDDDDDPVGCNYATETQDEANALQVALDAYIANQTTANCQAYVSAYQNYLNELEDHIDCATISGQQAELQALIDQSQDTLDNWQC